MISFDARRRKVQPGGISRPPHRHDCKRRLGGFLDALPGKETILTPVCVFSKT